MSSQWRIRAAQPDEANRLTDIAIRAKSYWDYPEEWIASWIPNLTFDASSFERWKIFVAAKAGKIAGVVALVPGDDDWGLEHLWIHPDYMQLGLGKRLLERGLKLARQANKALRLHSDPGALGFYEKHGGEHVDDAPSSIPGRTLPVVVFFPDLAKPTRTLLNDARACEVCRDHLPFEPRPIIRLHQDARVLIVGQAPGTRVHETGVPWNDPSGDRLRSWFGVTRESFYDPRLFAIAPAGLCYPGKGKSGDLPPRPECAPLWQPKVLKQLTNVQLTILIGQYAQRYYLRAAGKKTLTETVKAWQDYGPTHVPLPHPSPRNQLWLRRNPWFDTDVVPQLRAQIKTALQ